MTRSSLEFTSISQIATWLYIRRFWSRREGVSPSEELSAERPSQHRGIGPLGLSVYAFLSLVGKRRRPAMATIVVGAMVSLTIEVLQGYLPTRDPG